MKELCGRTPRAPQGFILRALTSVGTLKGSDDA
jgi:hypothetical protein